MTKVEALKKDNLFETNEVSSKELFGIKTDIKVPQFVNKNEYCSLVDENYVFDDETTLAILLGLKFNKRVFYKVFMELVNHLILSKYVHDLIGLVLE